MFDPILVTLLTMQPHYSQSSCENEPYPGAHPHKPVTRKYPPEKAWTLKTTIWHSNILTISCNRRRRCKKEIIALAVIRGNTAIKKVFYGEAPPRPLPFYIPFLAKKVACVAAVFIIQ